MTTARNVFDLATRVSGDTMIDLSEAASAELILLADGRLWLNVDGVCIARIKRVKEINLNITSKEQSND